MRDLSLLPGTARRFGPSFKRSRRDSLARTSDSGYRDIEIVIVFTLTSDSSALRLSPTSSHPTSDDPNLDEPEETMDVLTPLTSLVTLILGVSIAVERVTEILKGLIPPRYATKRFNCRGSMILTSNKSYGDWGTIFSDNVIASAILDQQLHHSTTDIACFLAGRLRNSNATRRAN